MLQWPALWFHHRGTKQELLRRCGVRSAIARGLNCGFPLRTLTRRRASRNSSSSEPFAETPCSPDTEAVSLGWSTAPLPRSKPAHQGLVHSRRCSDVTELNPPFRGGLLGVIPLDHPPSEEHTARQEHPRRHNTAVGRTGTHSQTPTRLSSTATTAARDHTLTTPFLMHGKDFSSANTRVYHATHPRARIIPVLWRGLACQLMPHPKSESEWVSAASPPSRPRQRGLLEVTHHLAG